MTVAFRFHSIAFRIVAWGLLAGLTTVALPGCSLFRGASEPDLEPLTIQISGTEALNGGNAAYVHVYQLVDDAGFRNAPLESFWQAPDQTLGDAMLSSSQIQLFPGEDEALSIDVGPAARYVGVAANLRDPDRDGWRAVFPVAELTGRQLHVTVDADGLSAAIQ